jgi:Ca-activated chloride channel family protein
VRYLPKKRKEGSGGRWLAFAACLLVFGFLASLSIPMVGKAKMSARRLRESRHNWSDMQPPSYPPDESSREVAENQTRYGNQFPHSRGAGVADSRFRNESYSHITDNAFRDVTAHPLSTFSVDVDTASYSNIRRMLAEGQLPPPDAVRIEELVNYFRYDLPQPKEGRPFSVTVELAPAPWNPGHRLARVALKGREIAEKDRPAANLVFLIDVSGSMQPENKLPLVKRSLKLLVERLKSDDTVALVVYAGSSGVVLEPTSGSEKAKILRAIDSLGAGGSTNGGEGIERAYELAAAHFLKGGINRVVLATDGDFNVGVTSRDALVELIERRAKSGVFLTVLGFGMGNLKDATLEKLADKGNGNYGYVDNFAEAKKLLVDQVTGTLVTIAKDVKLQVEFNPAQVKSYRLIGYENRVLAAADFNNDKKDAGEIGAGHTVTALYELVPADGVGGEPGAVDALKYQPAPKRGEESRAVSAETLTVKLRYKAPDADKSELWEVPVTDEGRKLDQASADLRFASAVAGFGMVLRNSPHAGDATLDSVQALAEDSLGEDPGGLRKEFLTLVEQARRLKSGR